MRPSSQGGGPRQAGLSVSGIHVTDEAFRDTWGMEIMEGNMLLTVPGSDSWSVRRVLSGHPEAFEALVL
jgi:hypothetical protein